MTENSTNSVVLPWLADYCTLKQQTVLLTSFRGCDGAYKNDIGKPFTRLMRMSVLKNADPCTTFFPDQDDIKGSFVLEDSLTSKVDAFFNDMDHYPVHWFMHLLHAAEIVGYKHPHTVIRSFWLYFYTSGVHELHLNKESEEELDRRLE